MNRKLNDDVAVELGAIVQYITHSAKTTGPYLRQLLQFYLMEVADEQLRAQFVPNKIVTRCAEIADRWVMSTHPSHRISILTRPNTCLVAAIDWRGKHA